MNAPTLKIFAILLLFLGEALAIYAEVATARHYSIEQPFLRAFLKGFLIVIFAGGLLVAGYLLGIKAFKNIWIVSAISITSILMVEPILDYAIFRQLPTSGALIGLILGATGFVFALFYK